MSQDSLASVRAVADAVLYEGYLLYPYRATSAKNQVRWQFGVLGPPGAADHGFGEEPSLAVQCLLLPVAERWSLEIHLRFLQLQVRTVEQYDDQQGFAPVEELVAGEQRWLGWDEAVEQHVVLSWGAAELRHGASMEVTVAAGEDVEEVTATPSGALAGRVVRRRWPLQARITAATAQEEGCTKLEVDVDNLTTPAAEGDAPKDTAIRASLIGTHLILQAQGADFVSVVDPPPETAAAAGRCLQHRCWPVLAGERADEQTLISSVVLAAPIILYDFPALAVQSAGDLFDATEIDEILTLRVMTMTDEEKAEARATDPRAREIIDRCDALPAASLRQLHGILRNPHAATDVRNAEPPTFGDPELPWWDPAADEAVQPELDSVVIDGVPVSKGSLVRVHPSRRADAQDVFFADQEARVAAVLSDVDGGVHVALVLTEDPGSDLHHWYRRYWYFAPDELEPLPDRRDEPCPSEARTSRREEGRS
jgi:hypothetical protein